MHVVTQGFCANYKSMKKQCVQKPLLFEIRKCMFSPFSAKQKRKRKHLERVKCTAFGSEPAKNLAKTSPETLP